jgi:hypothetical protein
MKIEVDIEDGKLQNLSQGANVEITKVAKGYIEDVLDEASRIEESRRISTANAEITAAIVTDAVVFAKRFGIAPKKPKRQVWIQGIAFLASIFTGGLFQIDKFTNVWFLLAFLLVFCISILTSFYSILTGGKND